MSRFPGKCQETMAPTIASWVVRTDFVHPQDLKGNGSEGMGFLLILIWGSKNGGPKLVVVSVCFSL